MTREEGILLSAYTGYILAPDWNEIQKFCEDTLGYPTWTHELRDPKVQEELRQKLRPQIVKLVDDIAESENREQKLEAENQKLKKLIILWQDYVMPTRKQVEKVCKGEFKMEYFGTGVCTRCHQEDRKDPLAHFCRYCGAPLDDKGVDMVMKRLEAMKNGT